MRRFMRMTMLALALTAGVVGVQLTTPASASASDANVAVRTLFYDARGAGEFVGAVNRGAAIWNSSVRSVRLQAGRPATITIVVDNGWPRAAPRGLGAGRIWMGRQAVNDGHDPTRIAAHEFGHILGLPDRRTGLCSDLMSGASAGTSCRNARPSAREAARVEANFGGQATVSALSGSVLTECVWAETAGHVH